MSSPHLHDQFDIYRVNAFSPLSDFTAAYNEAVAKGWQYAEKDLLEHFAITDEAAMRVSHVRNLTPLAERSGSKNRASWKGDYR